MKINTHRLIGTILLTSFFANAFSSKSKYWPIFFFSHFSLYSQYIIVLTREKFIYAKLQTSSMQEDGSFERPEKGERLCTLCGKITFRQPQRSRNSATDYWNCLSFRNGWPLHSTRTPNAGCHLWGEGPGRPNEHLCSKRMHRWIWCEKEIDKEITKTKKNKNQPTKKSTTKKNKALQRSARTRIL